MAKGLTPGVYVENEPTPGAIEGAANLGAAFLGHVCKSLPDKPTRVTSWDEFKSKFGAPYWGSYVHYAVWQLFNSGGIYCWIIGAGVNNPNDAAIQASVCFQSTQSQNKNTTTFKAASSGTWGNLLHIGFEQVNGLTNITIGVKDTDINPALYKKASLGEQTPHVTPMDRGLFWSLVQANPSITTSLEDFGDPKKDKVYHLETLRGISTTDLANIEGRLNGSSTFVRFECDDPVPAEPVPIPTKGWYAVGGGISDSGVGNFDANNLDENDAPKATYQAGVNSTVAEKDYQEALTTLEGIRGIGTIATPDIVVMQDVALENSGADLKVTLSNQLAIAVAAAAECEAAGIYWFYVMDSPATLNADDTVKFKNGVYGGATDNAIVSKSAAMVWPWGLISNPSGGTLFVPVPTSGSMIGRLVATDLAVGEHQAAAGVEYGALTTVSSLCVDAPITDDQQAACYPDGLNFIRNRVRFGICLWGDRTLSYETQWRQIPVVRMLKKIEQSLVEGLQQFVFYRNTPQLWISVTREVTAFLAGLWKIGALFGRTQNEAFTVICDDRNNTPTTIQQGYLYVKVEFMPVHSAEYIVLDISQKMTSADSGS